MYKVSQNRRLTVLQGKGIIPSGSSSTTLLLSSVPESPRDVNAVNMVH